MSFFYGASSMSTFLSPYQIGGGAGGGGGGAAIAYYPITWQNLSEVLQYGADNRIQKDAGAEGSWNSGAASVETIAGDGYLEFLATDHLNTSRIGSLSAVDSNVFNQFWADALFGIGLYATGHAWVVEGGGNDILDIGTYSVGDVFMVERIGTVVKYYHNGTPVYTSLSVSTGTLHVDVAIATLGGTLGGVQLVDTAAITPLGPATITPASIVGGSFAGSLFTKSAVDGWGNAGFSSVESVARNGYIEWTVTDLTTATVVGLSTLDADQHYNTIQYGWSPDSTASEILESGTIRSAHDPTVANTTVFRIERVGTTLLYYVDGVFRRVVKGITTAALFADVAVWNNSGTISAITMLSR